MNTKNIGDYLVVRTCNNGWLFELNNYAAPPKRRMSCVARTEDEAVNIFRDIIAGSTTLECNHREAAD